MGFTGLGIQVITVGENHNHASQTREQHRATRISKALQNRPDRKKRSSPKIRSTPVRRV